MKSKGEGKIIREHEYGRYGNPTQHECEYKLASIEGAERAILFSIGMAAVILTIMSCMKPERHIIFTSDCYRQTRDFAANMLDKFGVEVSIVDLTSKAIENAIRPNTNIISTESPTNPYLRILDLPNDLNKMQRMIGATPGPLTCFLLERGLKTFPLRMEHHNRAGTSHSRDA